MTTVVDATAASAALPLRAAATPTAADARLHYRPDIDGLRAVAVLAVAIFHFFPAALPGGFTGVDVFFVISGYLISRILLDDLAGDRFSLADFYARRVRRIFPALLVVLAACLAFGWIALFTREFAQLGLHATAGAAFVSNLVLWSESGYFDNAAITKPLLHLWSLGVEEQFYLVWPVLLALAWRFRLNLMAITLVLATASFAAGIVAIAESPEAAFYSPLTRFWELMTGAVLACLATRQAAGLRPKSPARGPASRLQFATLASLTGATLVVLGLVFVRESGFPGWQALVPTVGAALLILAGSQGPLNRSLLSNRAMVGLGLISYPLYLWHWPVLSFARIVHGDPGPGMRLMLLALSVVLAVLTYLLLEKPLRGVWNRGRVALVLCVAMVCLGGAGLLVPAHGGWPERAVVRANAEPEGAQPAYPPNTMRCPALATEVDLVQCFVDTREPPRFALLGDSKANALFPGLFRASAPGERWIFLGSGRRTRLVPVVSQQPVYAYVDGRAVDTALRTIEESPSVNTVVIATAARALFALPTDKSIASLPDSPHHAAALGGLDATVRRLLAARKQVVLLVDHPTLPPPEDCLARTTASDFFNRLLARPVNPACRIPVARHLELSRQYRHLLETLRDRYPGRVTLFDTVPLLCDPGTGICGPMKDGRLLYGVTDHLSDHASRMVGHALVAHLRAAPIAVP